jgi:DNA polymerase delta subunit 1
VLCHVHGFLPYFFVPAPMHFRESDLASFRSELDKKVRDGAGNNDIGVAVVSVEIVSKEDIYHYNGNHKVPFLKITTALPNHIPTAKRILEQGMSFGEFPGNPMATYESNIPFILRFMIDLKIPGMSWIEIPAGKYLVKENKNTPCQLEVEVQ